MSTAFRSRSLVIFYSLALYITIQFSWWAYLMIDLNKQVMVLQQKIDRLQTPSTQTAWEQVLTGKILMISGEGAVFLLVLLLAIFQIRRSHKKEFALAAQQRNFLMAVTHELKSPVASLKLYLQTLQKHKLAPEKQDEIIVKTLKDADRLQALVEKILLATKIDSEAFFTQKSAVNVSVLIADTITNLQESLGHDHETKTNIQSDLVFQTDPIAFTSIFTNLYENALKYSPKGKTVAVNLRMQNETLILQVADEGIGIPPAEMDLIFSKFYRVGSEDTRQTKGTGLGLYIVKSLVDLHGGKVKVKSNDPQGTCFEVQFKLQ